MCMNKDIYVCMYVCMHVCTCKWSYVNIKYIRVVFKKMFTYRHLNVKKLRKLSCGHYSHPVKYYYSKQIQSVASNGRHLQENGQDHNRSSHQGRQLKCMRISKKSNKRTIIYYWKWRTKKGNKRKNGNSRRIMSKTMNDGVKMTMVAFNMKMMSIIKHNVDHDSQGHDEDRRTKIADKGRWSSVWNVWGP